VARSNASTEILEAAVRPILEDYDYVVMDCPAIWASSRSTGSGSPTGPLIVKHVHHFSGTIGREIAPLGVLLTRYRPPTRLTQVSVKSLREDSTIPRILNTVIPDGELPEGSADFTPQSSLGEKYGAGEGGAFAYYQSLTLEVMQALAPA
jgi:chromosome partitioning protein